MRIAFTGSHGTGKTTAARILRKVINEEMEAVTIAPLGSVTRNVLSWAVVAQQILDQYFPQKETPSN